MRRLLWLAACCYLAGLGISALLHRAPSVAVIACDCAALCRPVDWPGEGRVWPNAIFSFGPDGDCQCECPPPCEV